LFISRAFYHIMHVSSFLLVLAVSATLIVHIDATCATVTERREWRTLSQVEQAKFIKAVRNLQTDATPSTYDKLVKWHMASASTTRFRPRFLPWYRVFLLEFEHELRQLDPTLFLPYWEWTLDSEHPETAPVFSNDPMVGFGRNGQGSDHCVVTGAFAKWNPQYPAPHCLERQWSSEKDINKFAGAEFINHFINTCSKFDELAAGLSQINSSIIFKNIGGPNGDLMSDAAPNDPLFFLLLANLDRYWVIWQSKGPMRLTEYNGTNADGTKATPSDTLIGFHVMTNPTGAIKVERVLDISKLCYKYADANAAHIANSLRLWKRDG